MKLKTLIGTILSVTSIVFLFVSLGLFSGVDASLSDRLFASRPVDERIVVIGIDNASLKELGQWPFPRALIAEGLSKLLEAQPASIAIDILFADPSRLGPEDDERLAEVLRTSTVPIVMPIEAFPLRLSSDGVSAPEQVATLPSLSGPYVHYGHINLIKDRDGLIRRFPRSVTVEEVTIPAFSERAVLGDTLHTEIERIVWSGKPGTIPHISFVDVVRGTVDPEVLKGAYVFLGATATDLHDEQNTPVSDGSAMAGVEIQAQIGNMLLKNYSLDPLPLYHFVLWLLIIGSMPILLIFYMRYVSLALIGTLALFLLNLGVITTLFERGWSVSVVHTSLTILTATAIAFTVRYFILERERREIRGVFSKYVSSAVLEELLKDPRAVSLGGAEAQVTVFFSDIRGFTTLSEKLSPSALTELLNRYLTLMTDIILTNNGVVDKYIGDAIMAFWGAPLKDNAHAYRAVCSALAMLESLDTFNAENEKRGDPSISIGIGLNTGDVIVGNMGSTQRFDYTIMGDAVNLGSRIEGQTKTYGVRLLASETTITSLRALERDTEFFIREVDKVTVKGKKEPVALYEIVERAKEDSVRSILNEFTSVREAYYRGAWSEVIVRGEQILTTVEDGPTRVLVERARVCAENPPLSWNGVYELITK